MCFPSFCLPCSPSHVMNILLNYLTQFCRPLSQYLQACVHWDLWEDSSLFITESSSYCNCNLHCNFHVVCESCAAHPAWTQHKFSALEDCAVGDQSWMLVRVPKWENYFCQAHPYERERAENGKSLSRAARGHGLLAGRFLFDREEENNSRGDDLRQRWAGGQLIWSTSCHDDTRKVRKVCRWSITICLNLLCECYLA